MRFSVQPNGHEIFKFAVHDEEIDEPIAVCWTADEARTIVEALNEKYPNYVPEADR